MNYFWAKVVISDPSTTVILLIISRAFPVFTWTVRLSAVPSSPSTKFIILKIFRAFAVSIWFSLLSL